MKTRKILTNDNSNFLTNEAPPISFSSLCFLVTTQLLSHHKIFQCVSSYGSSSYSGHSATSRCCGYPTSGWLVVRSSRPIRDGHLLSSLFVLLPNKTEATYRRMWEQIRTLSPLAQPREMLLDFDKAPINSFEQV